MSINVCCKVMKMEKWKSGKMDLPCSVRSVVAEIRAYMK